MPQSSKQLEMLRRRHEAARLHVQGWTIPEIARHFGVNKATAWRWIDGIKKEWHKESIEDVRQKANDLLFGAKLLWRTYWEAWYRSLEDKTVKSVESDGSGNDRTSFRLEKQEGNPAFLAGAERCWERARRIMGLDDEAVRNIFAETPDVVSAMDKTVILPPIPPVEEPKP
jgi:hypothetical protein